MKLIEMLSMPWAIRQEEFKEISAIVNAHLRGPKLNLGDMEARIMSIENNASGSSYTVENRTAIINIAGVMTKNAGAFERIFFGAMGMTDIQEAVLNAADDPEVDTILLVIDSPGGTVNGTEDLANTVFAARAKKKIVALANGSMSSAAYWVGSQAHEVYIANETTMTGSIGILGTHVDISKAAAQAGVTVTEIYSGKYKTVGSEYRPLSEDDRQILQDRADYVYGVFVAAVARGRGVSIEKVLADMADARVFVGSQAITAGLVDGVSTQAGIINKSQSGKIGRIGSGADQGKPITQNQKVKETAIMNIEQLKAEHPDVFDAVKKLGEADAAGAIDAKILEAKAAGIAEGAEAERKRIQDVQDKLIPGHEALIKSLSFDGKTTGDQAAAAVVKAEKEIRDKQLAQLRGEGPKPVDQEDQSAGIIQPADGEKPIEETAKAEWDKDAKLRAEFGNNYQSYLAFVKADKDGRVRIKRG